MTETQLPPELIEKFRQTGIRLDREGRFWHEDGEVTHERFRQALLRWLDLLPDGRPILRLDDTRYAYVDVDDALLLVTSLRWEDDRAFLTINDGSEEELRYDTLEQAADNTLYCKVRDGRLPARIATPAYYKLTDRIVESGEGFALSAAGSLHAIASH
jgi:hypothetical protein